jgi:hypothetical protein
MRLMRSRDPGRREDGSHRILPVAADYVDELIAEFRAEGDDRGLRCWLLELLAAARSPRAFDVFADQLSGSDDSLRWWAIRGLETLGTKHARRLLWQWGQNSSVVNPVQPGGA